MLGADFQDTPSGAQGCVAVSLLSMRSAPLVVSLVGGETEKGLFLVTKAWSRT